MLHFQPDICFRRSHHVLDEAERSLHDALCVLSQTANDNRLLLGGGLPEMVMAKEADAFSRITPGKSLLQWRRRFPRHSWLSQQLLLIMLVWTMLS